MEQQAKEHLEGREDSERRLEELVKERDGLKTELKSREESAMENKDLLEGAQKDL